MYSPIPNTVKHTLGLVLTDMQLQGYVIHVVIGWSLGGVLNPNHSEDNKKNVYVGDVAPQKPCVTM